MTDRAYLREFEQLVLLSVLRLGDEASGASIRRDLEQTAGRSVAVATIYVALSRMERRGPTERARKPRNWNWPRPPRK